MRRRACALKVSWKAAASAAPAMMASGQPDIRLGIDQSVNRQLFGRQFHGALHPMLD
jgi:hypothetical protein